jgi:hypothetical protein
MFSKLSNFFNSNKKSQFSVQLPMNNVSSKRKGRVASPLPEPPIVSTVSVSEPSKSTQSFGLKKRKAESQNSRKKELVKPPSTKKTNDAPSKQIKTQHSKTEILNIPIQELLNTFLPKETRIEVQYISNSQENNGYRTRQPAQQQSPTFSEWGSPANPLPEVSHMQLDQPIPPPLTSSQFVNFEAPVHSFHCFTQLPATVSVPQLPLSSLGSLVCDSDDENSISHISDSEVSDTTPRMNNDEAWNIFKVSGEGSTPQPEHNAENYTTLCIQEMEDPLFQQLDEYLLR